MFAAFSFSKLKGEVWEEYVIYASSKANALVAFVRREIFLNLEGHTRVDICIIIWNRHRH